MVICLECGEHIAVHQDDTPTAALVTHLTQDHGGFAEADAGHRKTD